MTAEVESPENLKKKRSSKPNTDVDAVTCDEIKATDKLTNDTLYLSVTIAPAWWPCDIEKRSKMAVGSFYMFTLKLTNVNLPFLHRSVYTAQTIEWIPRKCFVAHDATSDENLKPGQPKENALKPNQDVGSSANAMKESSEDSFGILWNSPTTPEVLSLRLPIPDETKFWL